MEFANGNKPSIFMLQYTVQPTHTGLLKFGSMCVLLTQQQQHMCGMMWLTKILPSDNSWLQIQIVISHARQIANVQSGNFHTNQNNSSGNGNKKPKYCWKFNKGICSEPYCKFPHKCYYCHGRHGINTCLKKDKKNQGLSNSAVSPKTKN